MSMISDIQYAATRPASFFKTDTDADEPSLFRPALVVAAVAIVGLLSSIPTLLAVAEATPGDAGVFVIISVAVGSLLGVIGPFLSWLIIGGLFFIGSLMFGGDGEFRDLFAVIGWGFAPRVIVPVIGGITGFILISGTNFSDPQQARQLSQMATTGTIGFVNHAVNAGTFIWAGWIWTHAVAQIRNISIQNAGIVVGAVVVVQILLNVGLSFLSASFI